MKQYLLFFLLLLGQHRLTAQWQHLSGPDGGYVINFDQDQSHLYQLTKAGIYRSDDEGYHWALMAGSQLASRNIDRLTAENGIFYGKSPDGQLLRSRDGGQTWKAVLKKPFPITADTEILLDVFAKGDTVLVSSIFTIYRSVDQGDTWSATGDLFGHGHSNIFSSGNKFFAWRDFDVYQSPDNGQHWEQAYTSPTNIITVGGVGDTLFVFSGNSNQFARTTDGFDTWQILNADTLSFIGYQAQIFKIGNVIHCVSKGYSCVTYWSFSSDGGINWQLGNGTGEMNLSIAQIIPFGTHLVLPLQGAEGIRHSFDAFKTFVSGEPGIKGASIKSLLVADDRTIYASAEKTAYSSKDGGSTWVEVASNLTNPLCGKNFLMAATQKRLYLIGRYAESYYSEDDGVAWNTLPVIPYLYGFTKNSFWLMDQFKLTRIADEDGKISFLDFKGKELIFLMYTPEHLIIKTSDGNYLITDGEGRLSVEIPPDPEPLFSPKQPNYIHFDGHHLIHFLGQNAYIFTEGATEWKTIYPQDWTTGAPLYHHTMTAVASHEGLTFVALEGKGIFFTHDDTGRFYPMQPQLPYLYPTSITFKDNKLWVGTDGGGIYSLPFPSIQAETAAQPIFRHGPTPSDGHLHLECDAFFAAEIQLDVLDMAGRSAATMVLHPGQTWDLDFPTLSKGLYVLMLRTPLGVSALKWSVMK